MLTKLKSAIENNDKLAVAVYSGEVDLNKAYIELNGRTVLQHAVLNYASEDILALLLDVGSNPDTKDMFGSTALHLSAQVQGGHVAKLLLGRGADVAIECPQGTPLQWAVRSKNIECVSLFLESVLKLSEKESYLALYTLCTTPEDSTSLSIVEMILAKADNVDIEWDSPGQTPLHLACKQGNVGTAEALLLHGASIEMKEDIFNNVPYCIEHGLYLEEIVQLISSFK